MTDARYLAEIDGILYEYTRPDVLLIDIAQNGRKPDRLFRRETFGAGRVRYAQVSDAAMREDMGRMGK